MTSPHQHTPYAPPSPHSTPTPTPTPATYYPPPPPPPPPFSPFFTLISTPHTTAHKHPIVHYIFSDDDIDPLPESPPDNQDPNNNSTTNDRVIIVDVGATTTDVSAVSMSRDWQVLGVKIEDAPQWAGESGGGGLMLTIEGTDAGVGGAGGQKRGERGMGMEELAEAYKERMELLKRVVEFGAAVQPA